MRKAFNKTILALAGLIPASAFACNTEPYIATICTYAMDWCPQGYLPADGRQLAIREYTALFGLIGFVYGGDNQNYFAIPDLRGRTPVGKGQGPGLPNAIALAQKFGQQQLTLTAAQVPLAAHTHAATFTPTTGTAPVTIPAYTGNQKITAVLPVSTAVATPASNVVGLSQGQEGYLTAMSAALGATAVKFSGPYTTSAPLATAMATLPATVNATGTPSTAASTVNITTVTGGAVSVAPASQPTAAQAVPTYPPSMGMSVCIAVVGLYPSRP